MAKSKEQKNVKAVHKYLESCIKKRFKTRKGFCEIIREDFCEEPDGIAFAFVVQYHASGIYHYLVSTSYDNDSTGYTVTVTDVSNVANRNEQWVLMDMKEILYSPSGANSQYVVRFNTGGHIAIAVSDKDFAKFKQKVESVFTPVANQN